MPPLLKKIPARRHPATPCRKNEPYRRPQPISFLRNDLHRRLRPTCHRKKDTRRSHRPTLCRNKGPYRSRRPTFFRRKKPCRAPRPSPGPSQILQPSSPVISRPFYGRPALQILTFRLEMMRAYPALRSLGQNLSPPPLIPHSSFSYVRPRRPSRFGDVSL